MAPQLTSGLCPDLALVVALRLEAHFLRRSLGLARRRGAGAPAFFGEGSGRVGLAQAGVGPRNLERAVMAFMVGPRKPRLLVSTGFCGAIAPGVQGGDLVVGSSVFFSEGGEPGVRSDPWALEQTLQLLGHLGVPHHRGAILPVPRLVSSPAEKQALWLKTGATAVDMESGHLAALARSLEIPFLVVRAVSDTASDPLEPGWQGLVGPDGGLRPLPLVGLLIRKPRVVLQGLAMERHCWRGARHLGRFLSTLAREGLTPRGEVG